MSTSCGAVRGRPGLTGPCRGILATSPRPALLSCRARERISLDWAEPSLTSSTTGALSAPEDRWPACCILNLTRSEGNGVETDDCSYLDHWLYAISRSITAAIERRHWGICCRQGSGEKRIAACKAL